jgi:hypothetical protein
MDLDLAANLRDIAIGYDEPRRVAALEQLAAPDALSELIDQITTKTEIINASATRSYEHPNGFDRICLHNQVNQGEVRLHIWWYGTENDETIHNHAWDFRSVTVIGNLRYQIFAESEVGDEFHRYRSGPSPTGKPGEYVFQYSGPTRLETVFEGSSDPGSAYWLRGTVFHRVLAHREISKPTVTLVRSGPMRGIHVTLVRSGPIYRDHSEVMLQEGVPMPPARSLQLFRGAEIVERLRALRNYL